MLTPDLSLARLDRRGFYEKSAAARQLLETVGVTFLTGFGYAAEAKAIDDAQRKLETVDREFRGFAYEGAAMACAVRDALRIGGGTQLARFLSGRGGDHVYMVHVGVGWAFARLPRWRWSVISPADRLLRWLVLDGLGFHHAYFHTARHVYQQQPVRTFGWPSAAVAGYASRAVDQGIGRALWSGSPH